MPTYSYKCDLCGTVHNQFRAMSDRVRDWRCPDPKCPGRMRFHFLETLTGSRPTVRFALGFDMGYSDAMGINPDYPQDGLPGETYTPDGALVIRGPAHRRECMRKLGLRDR